jgi:hypothetical protein
MVPLDEYYRPRRARELRDRAERLETWRQGLLLLLILGPGVLLHPATLLALAVLVLTHLGIIQLLWGGILAAGVVSGLLRWRAWLGAAADRCEAEAALLEAEHRERHGGSAAGPEVAALPPRLGSARTMRGT